MKHFFANLRFFASGMVVGIANLIPGVSGGTMALILGLYERLITAINNISVSTVLSFFKLFTFSKQSRDEFAKEMEKIDLFFLLVLFGGALVAVVLFAKLMLLLLTQFHDPTYGFFFGLVLPSVYVPLKLIKKISAGAIIALLLALCLLVSTDLMVSDDEMLAKETQKYELKLSEGEGAVAETMSIEPVAAIMLFVAGVAAISAMILPGVSGSFVLLLLGQYFILLRAVSEMNIPYLLIFMGGLAVGIVLFTKLLHFLLKRFHDTTMGFLTGLVAGSLWVIWPFKSSASIGTAAVEGYPETIYLSNTIPAFDSLFFVTLAAFVAGVALVIAMIMIEKRQK